MTEFVHAVSALTCWVTALTPVPLHLLPRPQGHPCPHLPRVSVPEIGDEVAVARALRHLADQLLDTAARDVAAVTGMHLPLRPT